MYAFSTGAPVAGGSYTPTPTGTISLSDNSINVPVTPNPGGKVPAGATVRGIQVLALPMGGKALIIEGNTIANTAGGRDQAKPMIGLDAQLSFTQFLVQRQNRFIDFDEGIRLMDAAGATTREEYVTDNYFSKNGTAMSLSGQQYATFAPAISCNTIENGDVGIVVESSSTVGQLSGPQGGPGPYGFEPVANRYNGLGMDVQNDGPYNVIYYGLDNPFESPNFGAFSVQLNTTPGTACAQRPTYGPGIYGLNRPAAGNAPNWQAWESAIRQPNGGPRELHGLILKLIDYRERSGQLPQLESYANTLPLINDEAFDRISLYLMEEYRHLGQDADAQRVRQSLLSNRGQSAEVQLRVAYFDVAGHLRNLAPGTMPAAADSTALVTVAGSSSGFAPVACATLRYFYPQTACGGSVHRAVARPTALAQGKALAVHLRAYPNPTQDQIHFQLDGTSPLAGQLELLEVATGRLVLTKSVTKESDLTVSVANLPPGVYAGRLQEGMRTVGTCKIVVIH